MERKKYYTTTFFPIIVVDECLLPPSRIILVLTIHGVGKPRLELFFSQYIWNRVNLAFFLLPRFLLVGHRSDDERTSYASDDYR